MPGSQPKREIDNWAATTVQRVTEYPSFEEMLDRENAAVPAYGIR
jgi:hypothetical protein